MEFNLPVTAGALLAIVAVGTAGLIGMDVMAMGTVLMMVAPSMLVFGLIALFLGIKHGEYRATR
ncbi:hypothetical protein SAMN05421858_0493 [Haladaptatus litoreus]|uniref:Uncharacterized protein n=1 Tax=Haladaptatus litoreus TaxID=553468 RepID=A0A1N6VUJ0_9EURY|nr:MULTISPECIES: hypothetical protein [Haladaptatus]SIQ81541.1 hypothetical protein SAMN05421858_0493 [Haladaptatus litoreus]